MLTNTLRAKPSRGIHSFLLLIAFLLIGCDHREKAESSLDLDTIRLQVPKGEFNVGVVSMNFIDSSRVDVASKDESAKRKLYTQVWYPTEAEPEAIQYLINEKTMEGFAEIENETWINRFKKVRTNSTSQAKISSAKTKFPVIFFSAGFGLSKNYNTMFLEGLASHGFIVVSIDLPYVNPLVTDSGESINSTNSFWDSFPMTKGIDDYEIGKKKFDFTYEYFTQDYEFIYNQLSTLKDHPVLGESLDLEKVASIGHSAGSVPTFGLMMKEKSPFKAFVVYDVNLHANYVSETMFFEKANRTYSPVCLFMLEYASIPPQDFVNLLNAELSMLSFKGTRHNSISDLDYIRHIDQQDEKGAELAIKNINKIINGTVYFLLENLR